MDPTTPDPEPSSDTPDRAAPPWPPELLPLFERAITCEYATLTRRGAPVTWPVVPYVNENRPALEVSTGVAYPAKAERARANPHVALLFSDPVGTGLDDPPVVLVQGLATVRDADLQANTDRYVRRSLEKLPAPWRGLPRPLLRAQRWYWARIWVEVTPLRILWWPSGAADLAPRTWAAPAGTLAPPSDPPPPRRLSPWRDPPAEWQPRAEAAARTLGLPVLTVPGPDGFPVAVRALSAALGVDGFRLQLPGGMPGVPDGPACLTFHHHDEVFVGQDNSVFVGRAEAEGPPGEPGGRPWTAAFRVERALADFSLGGSMPHRALAFLGAGAELRRRARMEAARRGQPLPRVRTP